MLKRRLAKKNNLDGAAMLSTARKLIRALRYSRYRVLPFDDPDEIQARYDFTRTTGWARRVTDEYRKHRHVTDPEEIARLHRRAIHMTTMHDALVRHEKFLYDGGWRTKRTQRDMINITAQSVGFATPLKKSHLDTYDPENPQPLVRGKNNNRGLAGFRYTERAPLSSGGLHEEIFAAQGSGQGPLLGGVGLGDPTAEGQEDAEEDSCEADHSEDPAAGSRQ